MKDSQRRLPNEATQQVDQPEIPVPRVKPEIYAVPLSAAPHDEDFAVYLDY